MYFDELFNYKYPESTLGVNPHYVSYAALNSETTGVRIYNNRIEFFSSFVRPSSLCNKWTSGGNMICSEHWIVHVDGQEEAVDPTGEYYDVKDF